MEALSSMQTFLKSRPSTFGSLEEGIEWRYGTAVVQHCSFLHYVVKPGFAINMITWLSAISLCYYVATWICIYGSLHSMAVLVGCAK